ncbi:hypothetical protein RB195_012877 [Necator americanus]|uniref:SART-1 family protein n=1 Tax=Necator americanus TaxID=51031 RepID=A0ABR1DTP2_NECAM
MRTSSRTTKKRRGNDNDSDDGRRHKERKRSSSRSKSRSPSPKVKRSRRREKERESTPQGKEDYAESLSIEETNKLRAKLGLAPLDVDDTPKTRETEDGLTVHVEDGLEFRHKKPENWSEKKKDAELKEKLEVAKKKRIIYEKLLSEKGLAESDSDDDTSEWVTKMRKIEEEKKRAEERAKMLDAMDEEFGVNSLIADEKAKQAKRKMRNEAQRNKSSGTGGLIVGHSKEAFSGVSDRILVLEDKGVLDEGDEVLVDPNLIDNEKYARNVELKKRKELQRGFDDVDEFGKQKSYGVLTKYDEELDGVQREKFRLDERGGYDIEKDEREARMMKELEMVGKVLVNMDTPSYRVGTEFYTQEEMTAFRKVKKGNKKSTRKRKILKAEDLVPEEPASGRDLGSRNHSKRREMKEEDDEEMEGKSVEPETVVNGKNGDDDGPSLAPPARMKRATKNPVDINMLRDLANEEESSEGESTDEELDAVADLAGVVINDDAEDELSSVLDKARRLKQIVVKKEDADVAQSVRTMISSHDIKEEMDDEGGMEGSDAVKDGVVTLDATMEYCRNIGEIPTYGLAGNRTDAIDVSEMKKEEDDVDTVEKWKLMQAEKEQRRRERLRNKETARHWSDKPGSSGVIDSDDEKELQEAKETVYNSDDDSEDDSSKKEYENVLGKEADVSKGVGAMLKLAAQKGYLNDNEVKKKTTQNLDHLRNQSKTQVEQSKYDIEDKYAKKLDRLGTTSRGPILPFAEKKDYHPEVNIHYVDDKGRVMDQKDAYRELSYKFHGRNPGKKQTEKRISRRDKKEMLKQMNSSDTPLGTLSKQLKKQEQLQTPYLVLSGSGRSDHTSLKKE